LSRLAIHYQDLKVGELAVARGGIFFEYATEFVASEHELSPFHLSLGSGVKARDAAVPTMRLPGLLRTHCRTTGAAA
jgi:serine/threonine-protein kinase HipA